MTIYLNNLIYIIVTSLNTCLSPPYCCWEHNSGLSLYFCPQQQAFLTSALVTGALFFLCSLVLFLGVTEQQGGSHVANG